MAARYTPLIQSNFLERIDIMVTYRCYVSGRVQGVFYRLSTQREAKLLQINGYAKNLPDGRVEVIAQGDPANINRLIEWCKKGPEMSRVDNVQSEEYKTNESYTDFKTY